MILDWILGNFQVNNYSSPEAQFPCPKCGHNNFYFNINKQTGYCHRAKCHYTPTLNDLIDLIGYGPNLQGYIPQQIETSHINQPVTLPVGATKNLSPHQLRLLAHREISSNLAKQYQIHATDNSLIIPIYEDEVLINYVRRFYNPIHANPYFSFKYVHKRYEYAKGIKTTNYLFDWDIHCHTHKLSLVENTFNAIWLGAGSPGGIWTTSWDVDKWAANDTWQTSGFTTNFGSHLSDVQIEKITKSAVKSVVLIWDEGANASKYVKRLKNAGVRAGYVTIRGQPDDHTSAFIIGSAEIIHERILKV